MPDLPSNGQRASAPARDRGLMKALAPKEKLATRAGLAQFLRFGLVGVANTATSYIVIRLLPAPSGWQRGGVPPA